MLLGRSQLYQLRKELKGSRTRALDLLPFADEVAEPAEAASWTLAGLRDHYERFSMNWYHYAACFFAGMFLTNFVPHFVKGVCGDRFPTPFAKPPGKALSSPLVNVLWSLLNLLVGYVLARVGRLASGGDLAIAACFVGVVALSTMCSVNFAKKHAV